MIAIVDYQAGNLASVQKALTHLGCESRVTSDPDEVRRSDRVILPGVGHSPTPACATPSMTQSSAVFPSSESVSACSGSLPEAPRPRTCRG